MKVKEPTCPRDWTRMFKNRDAVALRAKEVPNRIRALSRELEALQKEDQALRTVMYRMPKIEMFNGVPLTIEKDHMGIQVEGLGTRDWRRATIYRPVNMGDKPGFNVRVSFMSWDAGGPRTREVLYWLLPRGVALETAKRWCADMDLPEEALKAGNTR